jgi:DNA (cytosine-5)-methyltransferase 1
MLIGATLCSGIGAPEMAAPWIDWRLAAEIEPFPRAVLSHRFGYRAEEDHRQGEPLLWRDMSEISPELLRRRGVPLPDLIVAGTPCQAFSLAGLRGGLGDARGNLTLKFVEICHAIDNARPDGGGGLVALWENVPGVLSDKSNAFGCLLGGLVGADDPLDPPPGASWPSAGMVSGPRSRVAWRVLDAQYFGVPQRRRRVFLVADFGGRADPAEILFEPQGVRGDPAPRRSSGEGVAAGALRASQGGCCVDHALAGHLIPAVANTLTARMHKGINTTCDEGQTLVPICFSAKDYGADAQIDLSPTLRAGGHSGSHANAGVMPAVAFDLRGREGGAMPEGPHETANIRAASGGLSRSYLAAGAMVRRLTPVECARLQGFPDDHCAIPWRGKIAADGPQYKAYGNSMAVPVVAWILERLARSMGVRP